MNRIEFYVALVLLFMESDAHAHFSIVWCEEVVAQNILKSSAMDWGTIRLVMTLSSDFCI